MSSGDVRHQHRPTGHWHELRRVYMHRMEDERVRVALGKRYNVNTTFDIAYIAGISTKLDTLYVDRHFPLQHFDKAGDVTVELWLHECFEALCILIWADSYMEAHRLATVAEHDLVTARGVDWNGYKSSFKLWDKRDEHEKIVRSPANLFLEPYKQSHDYVLLRRIQETMQ